MASEGYLQRKLQRQVCLSILWKSRWRYTTCIFYVYTYCGKASRLMSNHRLPKLKMEKRQRTTSKTKRQLVGMTAFSWLKVQNENGQSAMQLILLNGKLVILCPQLIRTSIPVDWYHKNNSECNSRITKEHFTCTRWNPVDATTDGP